MLKIILRTLVLCAICGHLLFAATIKKKNGQVVEGEIQGMIVQKGEVKESPGEKDPSIRQYTVTYYVVNGSDIASIDESGVRKLSPTLAAIIVSQPGSAPRDADAVMSGVTMPGGAMFGATPAGGQVIRVGGTTREAGRASKERIVGEFRMDPGHKNPRIIPALEVSTARGKISIPVAELIAFKRDAQGGPEPGVPPAATAPARPTQSTPEARALLAKIAEALGGAEKVRAVKSVREKSVATYKTANLQIEAETTMVFPDRLVARVRTPAGETLLVASPDGSYQSMGSNRTDLSSSSHAEMMRWIHRDLIYVSKHAADYVAKVAGQEKLGDIDAKVLELHANDVDFRWFVDSQSGRVLRSAYSTEDGPEIVDFADWKTLDGISLPFQRITRVRGEQTYSTQVQEVELNPTVDPSLFHKPASVASSAEATSHESQAPKQAGGSSQGAPSPAPNAVSAQAVSALNGMSASVGGARVLGLTAREFPSGREVQMTVMDRAGQRWILGVNQATAKPTTRLCYNSDGSLCVAEAAAESRYGMINGSLLSVKVGEAINAELSSLSKQRGISAHIKSIKIVSPTNVVVVSWELAARPEEINGKFAIDRDGQRVPLPRGE
jgi:hypothetical protein